MVITDQYLKSILKQILESYNTLLKIRDKPGDLELIKIEILKINGFLKVIIKKIESSSTQTDTFVKLLKLSKHFLENYSFEREIDTMSDLYSNDSDRIKNIRLKIIDSLQDKKLIETIETIFNSSD